jgi:hypothetical protein
MEKTRESGVSSMDRVGRWNVKAAGWMAMAAVLVGMGCDGGTAPEIDDRMESVLNAPQELTLQYGEEKPVGGSVLKVSFAQVLEDSRCPVDVVCVWAGNAVVELGIRMGMGPTVPLRINSTQEPRFADWNGVRVTLLELLPEPRAGDPPRPESYSVRVRLERVP